MIARRGRGQAHPFAFISSLHQLRGDYSAARSSRYKRTRSGLGGPADAHLRQQDYDRIREYARDMDRNDVLVGQMLDRATDSLVHNGFMMEPDTGDKTANETIADDWSEWSTNPNAADITGESCFADMEWLVWRASLLDGDMFALPLGSGHLQLIEGDRCQSPYSVEKRNQNLHLGVLVDDYYKPLQFWFARQWRRDQHVQRVGDVDRMAARGADGERRVYQVLSRKRVTQTRGLSAFKAVIDTLGMLDDISFAALVKQQISSLFGVFLEQTGDGPAARLKLGARATEVGSDGENFTEEELKAGLMVKLPRGMKPTEYSPKFPNPEWIAHFKLLVRLTGLSLNLPLFMVLMDSSETVFHGYRGELDLHRRQAEADQLGFAERFHRPVWGWRVRRLMERDPALRQLGARAFKVKIKPPRWGYIDPKTDAEADERRVNNLFVSPSARAAERGQDHVQIISETIRDNAMAIRAAIVESQRIETDTKVKVKWEQVLRLTAGERDVSKALTPPEPDFDPNAPKPVASVPPSKRKPNAALNGHLLSTEMRRSRA